MKRIVFILLIPLLPSLLSAQGTLVDTVRVLTDTQINLGTVNDSVSFYGQQGNPKTWKKFRMDSLAVYMQNKIGGGGGITNGNKGDITVSNLGATWTINSGAVTGAKTNFAGISGNPVNLLGAQSNGATDIISVGNGLDLTNGVLTATGGGGGGSGTVISITAGTGLTGGTITTTGTIAADLNTLMELTDTVSLSNRINAKLGPADTVSLSNRINDRVRYTDTVSLSNRINAKLDTLDGSVNGNKTNFSGINGNAIRLAGILADGKTDTVQVGGGLSLANGTLRSKQDTMAMIIACSDETTNITATGNPKVTFRTPFAITVTGVKASLTTASSSGNVTVDVKNGNTTILSGFLQIDANQTTSVTSGTQRTVTTPNIANDNEVKIDINAAGTGAKGLKVTILYIRP